MAGDDDDMTLVWEGLGDVRCVNVPGMFGTMYRIVFQGDVCLLGLVWNMRCPASTLVRMTLLYRL